MRLATHTKIHFYPVQSEFKDWLHTFQSSIVSSNRKKNQIMRFRCWTFDWIVCLQITPFRRWHFGPTKEVKMCFFLFSFEEKTFKSFCRCVFCRNYYCIEKFWEKRRCNKVQVNLGKYFFPTTVDSVKKRSSSKINQFFTCLFIAFGCIWNVQKI